MSQLGKITVDPDGAELSVTVDGGEAQVFASPAGGSPLSQPLTVSARTDFWVARRHAAYTVESSIGDVVIDVSVVRVGSPSVIRPGLSLGEVQSLLGEGGGGGVFEKYSAVLSADDPATFTGINLVDLEPGDAVVAFFCSLTVGFDGTTPNAEVVFGDEAYNIIELAVDASQVNTDASDAIAYPSGPNSYWSLAEQQAVVQIKESGTLSVLVDDGAGDDPESSVGHALLTVFVVRGIGDYQ